MNIPPIELEKLSPTVKKIFLQWEDFMSLRVSFNMPQSEIHAAVHCQRVLLYALIMGEKIFGNDSEKLETLAHAAIFHDTRRLDDYCDTGHGARAAVYYEQFCRDHGDITYHPASAYLMRFHDLDDSKGIDSIRAHFGSEAPAVEQLYAIFKDADALDRWRLGRHGLDPRYLRTDEARTLTEYSRNIVSRTMPPRLLAAIEKAVDETLARQNLPLSPV